MNEGIHPHAGFYLAPGTLPPKPGEDPYSGFVLSAEPTELPLGPAPTIISVTPNTCAVGADQLMVTITGTDFAQGCVAYFGAIQKTQVFIDDTNVQFLVFAGDTGIGGITEVSVQNSDGQKSNTLPFTIT